MDAVTPRKLTLDDLTREELLEYVRRAKPLPEQRDLWTARWEVANRKFHEADRRWIEAQARRTTAHQAAHEPGVSGRRKVALRKAHEAAWGEHQTTWAAREAAWEQQDRAWAELSACQADLEGAQE